ncbi:hypothetical protein BaRGS_00024931, partial [Batillaria attramentaria]
VRSWCNATLRGQSAEVVCHFSENIQQFTVWHYPPNRTRHVVVLSCGGEDGDEFQCPQMEPGYDIDKRLSDSISLHILNATYARGGRYECKVIGPGNNADPCELEINGKPDPPHNITVSNSTYDSFTVCWTPAYDKGLQQDFVLLFRPAGTTDDFTTVKVSPPSATCFRVHDLKPGSEYEISVIAVNEFGVSESLETNVYGRTQDIEAEEDVFLAAFIVFLVLFLLSIVLSAVLYFCWKKRYQGNRRPRQMTKRYPYDECEPDVTEHGYGKVTTETETGGRSDQSRERQYENVHPEKRDESDLPPFGPCTQEGVEPGRAATVTVEDTHHANTSSDGLLHG